MNIFEDFGNSEILQLILAVSLTWVVREYFAAEIAEHDHEISRLVLWDCLDPILDAGCSRRPKDNPVFMNYQPTIRACDGYLIPTIDAYQGEHKTSRYGTAASRLNYEAGLGAIFVIISLVTSSVDGLAANGSK